MASPISNNLTQSSVQAPPSQGEPASNKKDKTTEVVLEALKKEAPSKREPSPLMLCDYSFWGV